MITWICAGNVVSQPWHAYVSSFVGGLLGSGSIFTNKLSLIQLSVQPNLVGRATGIYVASMFTAAAIAGYLFGGMAEAFGWAMAGALLMITLSVIAFISMYFFRDDKCW